MNGNKDHWYITSQSIADIKENNEDNLPYLSPVGITDSIMTFINHHPNYFSNGKGIKNNLINLIKMQINANPTDVGLPVVVKVVYPGGNKWLTLHENCP